jgi:hypothetical protein
MEAAGPQLLNEATLRTEKLTRGIDSWFGHPIFTWNQSKPNEPPTIYGITAEALVNFMKSHPEDDRLSIVDTRPLWEASDKGKFFPFALQRHLCNQF